MKAYNDKSQEENRKYLRNNSTSAEASFWLMLKNRQVANARFRRQFSVGPYIIDFYCPEVKLGIELDGANHFNPTGRFNDSRRIEILNDMGIEILRFENKMVFSCPDVVLGAIAYAIERRRKILP